MKREELLELLRVVFRQNEQDIAENENSYDIENGPTGIYMPDEKGKMVCVAILSRCGNVVTACRQEEDGEKTYEFQMEELL